MKSSLREVLIESHVAAVPIAFLLFGALDCGFQGLCVPLWRVATYSFTAIAILDIPYSSPGVTTQDRFMLEMTAFLFVGMLANLGAAWLLARWAYGVGPIKALIKHRSDLKRRNFA
jgi:hypothetical protein